jgi:hypothetical protein
MGEIYYRKLGCCGSLTVRSPFPGMNPYLELPVLWPEFHNRLIVAISDALTPHLRPNYYAAVETSAYLDDGEPDLLVGIPDGRYLEVRSCGDSCSRYGN